MALVACGTDGDGDKDGGDGVALTPEQQFVKDAGDEGCRIYEMCAPAVAQANYTVEQCLDAVELSLTAWAYANCTFNAAAAQTCLASYEAITDCSTGLDAPTECDDVWDCPDA